MSEAAQTGGTRVARGATALNTDRDPVAYRFKKTEFLTNETTETGTNDSLGPRGGETTNNQDIEIRTSLKTEYTNFMRGYMSGLNGLKDKGVPGNPGRTMFDQLLNHPRHVHDRELFKLITDTNGRLDENKFHSFLSSAEGWKISTMVMERQTALKLFALGLHEERVPQGGRQDRAGELRNIPLGVDQGALNRAWAHMSNDERARFRAAGRGVVATALGGLAAGGVALMNPVLGLITAAELGTAGGLYGMNRLMRNGAVINMVECTGALQAIQNDPLEAAFVEATAGIRVNDLRVVGGRIERSPGVRITTRNAADIQLEVLRATYTREKFYRSIGVPQNRIDALPQQYLARYVNGQGEQSGVKWEQDIQGVFQPNELRGGGIQDRWGQGPTHPYFCREAAPGGWVPPMGLHAGAAETDVTRNMDFQGNIQRRMEAERKVLARMVQKIVTSQEEQAEKVLNETEQRKVEGKVRARTDADGARRKESNEASQKSHDLLTNINETIVTADIGKLETYQTAVRNLDAIRARARREIGLTDVASIDAELAARRVTPTDRLTELRTQLATAEQTVEDKRAEGESIDREFTAGIAQFENLMDLDNALRTAGGPGIALTQVDLDRLPFDVIMTRINEAHAQGLDNGINVGWGPESNSDPNIRLSLMRGIAEAKARVMDPDIAAAQPDFDNLIATGRLNENQLRSMTTEEVERLGNVVPPIPGWNVDTARTAIEHARRRFEVRSSALQDVIKFEPAQREEHNQRVTAERAALDGRIQRLETERNSMREEERAVDNETNIAKIAKSALDKDTNPSAEAYDVLERTLADPRLAALRASHTINLDLVNLHTLRYQDIVDQINIINHHAADLGWNPGLNTNDRNARMVINAMAESQARHANALVSANNHPVLDLLLNNHGFTEKQLREETSIVDIMKGARPAIPNTVDRNDIQRALNQARQRFSSRTDALSALLGNATAMTGIPDPELVFLRGNKEFAAYETALQKLNNHKANLGGVTDSAALETQRQDLVHRRAILQDYSDLSTQLTAITNKLDTYSTSLTDLQSKRQLSGRLLNGVSSVQGIQEIITRRENQTDAKLTEIRGLMETAEIAVAADLPASRDVESIVNDMPARLNELVGVAAGGAAPLGINDRLTRGGHAGMPVADLLTEPDLINLPYEEIMRRINAANTAGAAHGPPPIQVGWPEAHNKRPEIRTRVVHAIAEARARVIEASVAVPTPAHLAPVLTLGLTESQIRTLVPDELITQQNERGAGLPFDAATRAEAQTVIDETRTRYNVRTQAMQQTADVNTERIADLNDEILATNFDDEVLELEMTSDLIGRQEAIFNVARNDFKQSIREGRFTDTNPINPTNPNLTQAERDAALPTAYYELVNMMFDYQNNPKEDRQKDFQKIVRFLPPDELATMLNDSLSLVPMPANFDSVMAGINESITGPGIIPEPTTQELRAAFANIINMHRERIKALV